MHEWDYGGAYLRHPCDTGTIVFEDGSKLRVCDLTKEMPAFMREADALFIDPPWNQGNIRSFYTKAGITSDADYASFLAALFERIGQISPDVCYIEMGKEFIADVIMAMRKLFPRVTFFNSTYYHNRSNLCYVVRGGRKRTTAKLDGMDEEDIISWVCANEAYTCIGDLCMGRGLVAIGAARAGKRFVGTELNHKRLSVAVESLANAGHTYTIHRQ